MNKKRFQKLAGLIKEGVLSYQETFEEQGKIPKLPEKAQEKIRSNLVDVEKDRVVEDFEEMTVVTGFLPEDLPLEFEDETFVVPKGWYAESQHPGMGSGTYGPCETREAAKWGC